MQLYVQDVVASVTRPVQELKGFPRVTLDPRERRRLEFVVGPNELAFPVVPAAAAGSLMFAPDITLPALREMPRRFGERISGRYGFADAFHPTSRWVNPDATGIDLGITLLSAENLRSGRVWEWFMKNPEIPTALDRAGVTRR